MKQTGIIGLVCLALLLTLSSTALAHSKKGRMKIDLATEEPSLNDFAFFMESYVNKELYRDRFDKWESRFYVKDFETIERKGSQATVSFITLDTKENSDFKDSMTFEREEDGVWYYHTAKGDHVNVYTFVMKGAYYYQNYILPFSVPGLIVSACVLSGMFFVRKRKGHLTLPQ
jgi:hypothetical protein